MTLPLPLSKTPASTTPRYAWICVALLWVVWLLNYLDRQAIFAVFPLLQTELKLDPVQLGLVSTVFLWVYAVVGPFAGYFADRFGRKRLIVVSVGVWSAVTWFTGQARTLPQLLTARAFMGISEACYLPAGLAMIASWHEEGTRAKATGIHYSGGYLGMVMGGWLGGWMAMRYGWRWMFAILGIVGVIYAIALGGFLRERKQGDAKVPTVGRTRFGCIGAGVVQAARLSGDVHGLRRDIDWQLDHLYVAASLFI